MTVIYHDNDKFLSSYIVKKLIYSFIKYVIKLNEHKFWCIVFI